MHTHRLLVDRHPHNHTNTDFKSFFFFFNLQICNNQRIQKFVLFYQFTPGVLLAIPPKPAQMNAVCEHFSWVRDDGDRDKVVLVMT